MTTRGRITLPRAGNLTYRLDMKPYVICHMVTSIDGRILPDRWHPASGAEEIFERLHEELGGGSWLVGRVTGGEFAERDEPYPPSDETFPREPWFADRDAETWGVVLDAEGKVAWGMGDIGGDAILVVLTESVPDRHLAGLRADGVSYIFAGEREIDLAAAVETLNRELGIDRLMLEGGGVVNGALLRAGLVDELSLVIVPAIDGSAGAPSVFDGEGEWQRALSTVTLEKHEALEGGNVWLRYRFGYAQGG
jgi:riboflavin biosynthesis pyrimidine reductase